MFNSLRGIVTGEENQKIFLDTHGIEWEIIVPTTAIQKFPIDKEARVFTWLQHTDALMNLYGFASVQDRNLFFDLLKVDGIGPKGAIKIMSNIDSVNLANLLESGDVDTLQKVPGVGKKTAAKMLLQLKGKLTLENEKSAKSFVQEKKGPYADLISGLVSMGYDKRMSEEAIEKLSEKLKSDSHFESLSDSEKETLLLKQAIVELAQ